MITITIDGKEIQTQPGARVLDAALENGIDIPHLCHHKDLLPSGSCRMCLVQVEGRPKPETSCGMAAQDGLVINTQTEEIEAMRRDLIDLFVSDHPLDCVICDKNGNCDLQKYAYRYNVKETSFDFEISRPYYYDDNPFYVRDYQYCIMCGQCVRVCDEVVGVNAIEFAQRGFTTVISTPFDAPLAETSCTFCGSCVQVCPTAALQTRSRIGKGREWEMERKQTICGYCGVGCTVEYALKDHKIIYAQGPAKGDGPANGEFLCVKGRYGWDFVDKPERLKHPMIRKDLAYELGLYDQPWTMPEKSVLKGKGNFDDYIRVSWDQATDIVATKLADTVQAHGPDSIASLTSARCTNEENYLFQKFMRAGVGTNNVDHCARL